MDTGPWSLLIQMTSEGQGQSSRCFCEFLGEGVGVEPRLHLIDEKGDFTKKEVIFGRFYVQT